MPLRKEFETEFENEAEPVISSLSFQDDDYPEDKGCLDCHQSFAVI